MMNDLAPSTGECISRILEILKSSRAKALNSVNTIMVSAYWETGREIVEEEQRGQERAKYGTKLIQDLSKRLTREFGKGYSARKLREIRQFYLVYKDRDPSIWRTPCAKLDKSVKKQSFSELNWSHYRLLMRLKKDEIRSFYEVECVNSNWSVDELDRQINSLLFERLAKSRNKEGVMALAQKGHEVQQPEDLLKDPYVLEFTGLPEAGEWYESDLEQALIDRLQKFILELGRDLFFVARQKRITVDGDHYYIDLVFYHRVLRCFLLIDLKVGKLTQQDIGQMLMYTGYYEIEETAEDENPPVGLILCTDKKEALVRYTLNKSTSKIFASRYQLHLPSEEELAEGLKKEKQYIEHLQGNKD